MPSTLLNPACDTCYECCLPCGDYNSPNVWYALFCNVAAINTGYANRVVHTDGKCYFWESNSLAADINDLLVSFATMALSSTAGNKRTYTSSKTIVSALNGDIKVYSSANYSDAEVSFVAKTMKFRSMFAQLKVIDECGIRYPVGIVSGIVSASYGILNPQDWTHSPPNDNFPVWKAEHEYSSESPGVGCSELLTGSSGVGTNFVQSIQSADYPPLLGAVTGVTIKAQANNSMLSCGGYGG